MLSVVLFLEPSGARNGGLLREVSFNFDHSLDLVLSTAVFWCKNTHPFTL